MEFKIMGDLFFFFFIFLLELKITCQGRLKKKLGLLTNWIFLIIEYIFSEQIAKSDQIQQNSVKHFNIRLDDFRKNGKKNNLRGHF